MIWSFDHEDGCVLVYSDSETYRRNEPSLRIAAIEVIETFGRKNTIKHIKDCDNSPWLKVWQNERHEELLETLMKGTPSCIKY